MKSSTAVSHERLPSLVGALAAAMCMTIPSHALASDGAKLLEKAFQNRYGVGIASTIELELRSRAGTSTSRTIDTVSTRIDGRMHSIGRLVAPEHLRGMTILSIEATDRSHDTFIYLPSTQVVRRVSTAQRGDAFFRTDVTYEDLEQQKAADYEVEEVAAMNWGGESVFAIDVAPKRDANFARARFTVSSIDFVILRTEYFKARADEPFRVVEVDRSSVQKSGDHAIPTRFQVSNSKSGTTTQVNLTSLVLDPAITPETFSMKTLSAERKLPLGAR